MTEYFVYPDLQDATNVYQALVGFGLFTEKLPSCFTSKDLINVLHDSKLDQLLKPYIEKIIDENRTEKNQKIYHCGYIEYSTIRNTNVARLMGIPHPKAYIKQCKTIADNWGKINKDEGELKNKTSFCHVRSYGDNSPIFKMNYSNGEKHLSRELELEYSINAKYRVNADIANCFASIYTHSIPWGLVGKEISKQNTSNDSFWYNQIDRDTRNMQDQQTIGLIIGPHSSNILAEIILRQVDKNLSDKKHKFVRFIDDYKYYASSLDEAKRFINDLSKELKKFELRLNDKKTKIEKLPVSIEPAWILQLNLFTFKKHSKYGSITLNSALQFLDYALQIHQQNNENSAIFNYAFKILSNQAINKTHIPRILNRIFHLILMYPYLIHYLENFIEKINVTQGLLYLAKFENFINQLISNGIDELQPEPISFAMYFAIKYKIILDKDLIDKIFDSQDDCILFVMQYHYYKINQLCTKKFNDFINSLISKIDKDKYWLLAYECLTETELKNYDIFLHFLKGKNVEFVQQ
ncbi:MAG: RNA-directed DNA polymerase [Burkholderiales bacterium]|nr:RNA-directed DNA polymerase [Burkholderiales bacterium]